MPFVMARFGAAGQAAIAQSFPQPAYGGSSPAVSPFVTPFPGAGGPFSGNPAYGGTEQAEQPPQPPPGFADGIPGLGGINMEVAMQIAPVLVQFLTEISDEQVVEIAESEDGVVHLTPEQRRALLIMRKLFGAAKAPAG